MNDIVGKRVNIKKRYAEVMEIEDNASKITHIHEQRKDIKKKTALSI